MVGSEMAKHSAGHNYGKFAAGRPPSALAGGKPSRTTVIKAKAEQGFSFRQSRIPEGFKSSEDQNLFTTWTRTQEENALKNKEILVETEADPSESEVSLDNIFGALGGLAIFAALGPVFTRIKRMVDPPVALASVGGSNMRFAPTSNGSGGTKLAAAATATATATVEEKHTTASPSQILQDTVKAVSTMFDRLGNHDFKLPDPPRAAPTPAEIAEFCRDEESSGCDIYMIEALLAEAEKQREALAERKARADVFPDLVQQAMADRHEGAVEQPDVSLLASTRAQIADYCTDPDGNGCDIELVEAIMAQAEKELQFKQLAVAGGAAVEGTGGGNPVMNMIEAMPDRRKVLCIAVLSLADDALAVAVMGGGANKAKTTLAKKGVQKAATGLEVVADGLEAATEAWL